VKEGNGYLGVWADYRTAFRAGAIYDGQGLGTMADIYAARVDAGGNLLDKGGIVLSNAPALRNAKGTVGLVVFLLALLARNNTWLFGQRLNRVRDSNRSKSDERSGRDIH
jgi:hypothetical protein